MSSIVVIVNVFYIVIRSLSNFRRFSVIVFVAVVDGAPQKISLIILSCRVACEGCF